MQGTNITEAKQSIERSMDLLITAFENQLDKLFASDALDVSTDIAALEGMLEYSNAQAHRRRFRAPELTAGTAFDLSSRCSNNTWSFLDRTDIIESEERALAL